MTERNKTMNSKLEQQHEAYKSAMNNLHNLQGVDIKDCMAISEYVTALEQKPTEQPEV